MMKYLLDTHILLWAASDSPKLNLAIRQILENKNNELYFSVVNIWEIAIKKSIGKLHLPIPTSAFRRLLLENGYRELAITGTHAMATETLPFIHNDPFDRMLIAQAQQEGLLLLSADSKVQAYGDCVAKI
ncbi:type II toxin-antitoxin system VapC family toxin [Alysiella crassa]|nr:type II toxin-antitoxin system VapC family toxin [Alysiella crassa]UOP07549.1 type II toxin-antitoxin system VapC family toxin [Alysiella crassa]